MSNQKKDGGLAFGGARMEQTMLGGKFPSPTTVTYPGMSLRDWFAGQSLSGQLAFSPRDSFEKYHLPRDVARMAYEFADAMLAGALEMTERFDENDPDFRVTTYHSENADEGKEWIARVNHPRTKLAIFFEAGTEPVVASKANDFWNEYRLEREENWRRIDAYRAARAATGALK